MLHLIPGDDEAEVVEEEEMELELIELGEGEAADLGVGCQYVGVRVRPGEMGPHHEGD